MPVELNTLITAVVRAVLEQIDAKPAPVALVLAPKDDTLARQIGTAPGQGHAGVLSAAERRGATGPVSPELTCSDMADLARGAAQKPCPARGARAALAGQAGSHPWLCLPRIRGHRTGRFCACMKTTRQGLRHLALRNFAEAAPEERRARATTL